MKAFFDTNVLVYAATSDPRRTRAQACLNAGGTVSIQVLNEFANVARTKLRHDWPRIETVLGHFIALFDSVVPLTLDVHRAAITISRDHRVAFYDALIIAAAQSAGCDTLFTEDLQHGQRFGTLVIENPFLSRAP